jgi:hypothetical protein
MSRISQRISNRITEAFSTVKCPGCGKSVTPTFATPDDGSESGKDEDGKRWSFIWRPPSGEVCPECSFPISRYAYRRKWIQLFMAGIAGLTIVALLFIFAMMSGLPGWLVWIVRIGAVAALLTVVVGLVGIVVGGRHGIEPSAQSRA